MAELKKDIRLYGLIMVAIGSCIGSGIFLTPSQVAGHLPSPFLILMVWSLGGIITLTGALTFAELEAMFPQAGGVYVYLKEAYGDLFGFLSGIKIVAVLALVVVTLVNIFRVRAAEVFSNVFTGFKLLGIGAVIGIGPHFSAVHSRTTKTGK